MAKTIGTQSLVRNLLKSHAGVLRKSEIRDMIGYSGANGYAKVNNAVQDLLKAEEVERTGHGRYQYLGKPDGGKRYKSQIRIWRFMWIRTKKNDPFTVRKIHEITGVAYDTVKRYVTYLLKKGHVERVGQKRAFKTRAPLYLIASDKMSTEAVIMRRQRDSAQVETCLDEVRALAGQFFRVENIKIETIQNLLKTARRIADLLSDCEQKLVYFEKKNKMDKHLKEK